MIYLELTLAEALALLERVAQPNALDDWMQPLPAVRDKIKQAITKVEDK